MWEDSTSLLERQLSFKTAYTYFKTRYFTFILEVMSKSPCSPTDLLTLLRIDAYA